MPTVLLTMAILLTACTTNIYAPQSSTTRVPSKATTNYLDVGKAQAFVDASLADAGSDQVTNLTITPTRVTLGTPGTAGTRIYSTDAAPSEETTGFNRNYLAFPALKINIDSLVTQASSSLSSCSASSLSIKVEQPLRMSPTVSFDCGSTQKSFRWLDTGTEVDLDLSTPEGIDAALTRLKNGWPATAVTVSLVNQSNIRWASVTFPATATSFKREDYSTQRRFELSTGYPNSSPSPGNTFDPTLVSGRWLIECSQAIYGDVEYPIVDIVASGDGHGTVNWSSVPAGMQNHIPTRCQGV